VLLHAWGGRGADWQEAGWTAGLAQAGYDVLVPDLPGHAASAGVTTPEDVEPAAWTAAAIVQDLPRLHVKQCAVVGYADACLLAAHLAVRAPETVVRVVLVGCDDRQGYPQGAAAAAALRGQESRVWNVEVADLLRRARSDRRHDRTQLAVWLESAAWPAAPRLGALPTPVLLAVGTEDSHRAGAPRLAALFADARLVTVPGDDASVLRSPALVDAVVDFLSQAPVARPLSS
jgi:pimeloyl-ACP methyl ester carboxylesterase